MNDQQFDLEVLKAEEIGLATQPDNTNQHYTLGGIRVAEPKGNFGKDYWDINDALNAGCIILKPSIYGVSGMSLDEVKDRWFKTLKIYNGTSHKINLYSITDTYSIQDGRKLVLKDGSTPLLHLDEGTDLNAVKSNADLPDHLINSNLPLKGCVSFTSHDPIPEGYDIVIVSNLYRSAVKELGGDTSKLATVDGKVYMSEEDLKPCGCLNLAVG